MHLPRCDSNVEETSRYLKSFDPQCLMLHRTSEGLRRSVLNRRNLKRKVGEGHHAGKLDGILQRCTISLELIRPWFDYICPQLCTCDLCDGFQSHLRVDVDPES